MTLDRDKKRLASPKVLSSWGVNDKETRFLPNRTTGIGEVDEIVRQANHRLESGDWVYADQVSVVEDEQLAQFDEDTINNQMGFRPGTLVSTAAEPNPATDVIYAITNDPGTNPARTQYPWTLGVKRHVGGDQFTCLGYRSYRIISKVNTSELSLHESGGPVASCQPPNGAIARDQGGSTFILEAGAKRLIPDRDVFRSWGMGEWDWPNNDIASAPLPPDISPATGTKVRIGFRPGTLVQTYLQTPTLYFFITPDGGDFARGNKRLVADERAMRCYGLDSRTPYKVATADLVDAHHPSDGPGLNC